ncbi:MAG: Nif3-like dinuclear metal center hexameric protein [Myxococcales bacterium]|nr:Nif3-like dinuclear metal center hexameric protein [Myxococcales bacterium]
MSTPLWQIIPVLEALAPLRYAEEWDNVGLLIEPRREEHPVNRVLLTIDLGEDVLDEAAERGAELIVAYHPPIFSGVKRLTRASAAERVVVEALRAGIAVYSPHTALDASPGGVNDWLADALGPGEREPLAPASDGSPGTGMGRSVTLKAPLTLDAIVARVKDHLGLTHVRVASSPRHDAGGTIARVAVCAGAGGALFAPLAGPELYLTGEMRHHDVRAKVSAGASVILCDHTNTERGFLPSFARRLAERVPSIDVTVSARDRDPLRVV